MGAPLWRLRRLHSQGLRTLQELSGQAEVRRTRCQEEGLRQPRLLECGRAHLAAVAADSYWRVPACGDGSRSAAPGPPRRAAAEGLQLPGARCVAANPGHGRLAPEITQCAG